ncbi:AcrR family transcriptional regulator [Actinoalloteichus hoggarensis]|uniref:HTH-type transcriptional repressor ComR n=1 Tax=Actinoalloteichus hoggarensis TaxID=1470176 RepID=A0A221W5Y7_9PSEU|nr:TetR/AcrR family transcriptional regulator [Actinoalloteichus hoggarensis]ASO21268.1 HTH-type transcriptional repressor ComR [Actinoalloteichus hoggarensis]MBB5921200.1 AcrR family transcriptional regulator [Actinoalloteichus hoggarensis]
MATGRPREFDVGERLDRALEVFWRHGYEGAGLAELTEAMGISRPSLYAAYGNKESLFRKAVDRYLDGPARHIREAAEAPTARAAAEGLLRGAASVTTTGPSRGCLVVQSALVTGAQADAARDELVSRRRAGELGLRARFAQAKADGELGDDVDAADLARYIAMISYGISVQAADGAEREELDRAVDLALRAWPAASTPAEPAPAEPAPVEPSPAAPTPAEG